MEQVRYIIIVLITIFSYASWGQTPTLTFGSPILDTETCEYKYCFNGRPFVDGISYSDISQITWNFGDGISTIVNSPTSTDMDICHTYSVSGTYTASLQIVATSGTFNYNTVATYLVGNSDNGVLPVFITSNVGYVYDFVYQGLSFDGVSLPGHSFTLNFGDGSAFETGNSLTFGQSIASHTYTTPGAYTVTLTHAFYEIETSDCEWLYSLVIDVEADPCCSNFSPDIGGTYWISAWVKEEQLNQVKNYEDAYVELEFVGSSASNVELYPSGDIIEGWQRIVGRFVVPSSTTDLRIHLVNNNASIKAYFDDVRVHPFNASMKSYVYDPVTLWLTAELDDNNYATFYEYDQEGQLIRIKKETARGIMTIQESRSNNPKE